MLEQVETMDTGEGLRPTRPLRVKELVAQAENFHFNTNISLKHWTRAAETLYQEVRCDPSALDNMYG